MVAWFLITTLMLILFRLPFAPVQMLPFCLELNPSVVLVPLVGIFFGPAGAWGVMAATLLGDALLGMWSGLSFFRAMGFFLMALTAQQLWYEPLVTSSRMRQHDTQLRSIGRFIVVALPGSFSSAVWTGLGSELFGLYPFPYLASILVLHHLVFVALLAPAAYGVMVRRFYPHWGTWRDVMHVEYEHEGSMRRAASLWIGALGAYAAGCFAGATFYRIQPLESYVLGTTCGRWLPVLVIPFMLLHLSGFKIGKKKMSKK